MIETCGSKSRQRRKAEWDGDSATLRLCDFSGRWMGDGSQVAV